MQPPLFARGRATGLDVVAQILGEVPAGPAHLREDRPPAEKTGQATGVEPGVQRHPAPSVVEWGISLGLIAATIFLFGLAARLMPVLSRHPLARRNQTA